MSSKDDKILHDEDDGTIEDINIGAPLYISEISPPNLRGTLLVLESISICAGVDVSFYITYGTRHLESEIAFRLPLGLQMVSATIVGVGILFFPYSPRWLALVRRTEDALSNLSRTRRLPPGDSRVLTEYQGIIAEAQFQKTVLERRHPGKQGFMLEVLTWLDLFNPKTWRRTAVGCGILPFQQFIGINAFIFYAPDLFQSLGKSEEMSLTMSGIFNALQLVAAGVCFFIIDRVGRRPLAIFGGVGGVITPPMLESIGFGTCVFYGSWCAIAAGWASSLSPRLRPDL
ncbi:quinate transport [Fusarium mundagurra]|uniref:Quinate transport n=1 Tax=Fusarium mundagurra TaxID=1567541 RepID=A0A8H5Z7L9_9HYPO|nr:quinate transport [Fusarium mundagurra]